MANRLISVVGLRAFRTVKLRPFSTTAEDASVKEDFDLLQKEHETLRKDHDSLAEKYADVQDKYRRSLAETENGKLFTLKSFVQSF